MDKEIIEKVLLEISTPTGLTYSGDTTICNDEVKDIMNYINSLEQQCKKQKEVIDKIMNLIKQYGKYDGKKCTRGFQMWNADFNKILDMLKEVSE